MPRLEHLAGYRATRPARALVLVPLPDALPWQVAMMAALRGQAATWGGSANLVVPWTEDLFERDEFWSIAAALDPDVVALARLAGSDLGGIVPTGDPLLSASDVGGRVEADVLKTAFTVIAQRLPVLQRNGYAPPLFSGDQGVGFPCTPIAAVAGDLGPGPALRCEADIDLGLMLAAESGDLADSAISRLAGRGAVVTPHGLSPDEARSRVLQGPERPGASGVWTLSEAGLRWLRPVSRNPVTVSVVVGDQPWDFALGYALRRLTGLAWWLPTSVLADPWSTHWLLHRIAEIADLAERGIVARVSDRALATSVAGELATAASDSREWSVAETALGALHERPSRLLSRVPGLEVFALQDGETGYLPPELPEVGEALGQRIYWMSELLGDNWQPLPDARLATHVVRQPGYDSASARPTRSGAAYLCPNFVRMSEDMASEVVRPRIAVVDLHDQVAAILGQSGWRLEPSDKGQYADGASRLFGGDRELRAALASPPWWRTLTGLQSDTGPDLQPRGWKLADQRTYYQLAELQAIRAETGLGDDVPELLQRRILMRGLVFRCPLCRFKAWYGADELADRLRCARCREPFALTDRGWQPDAEPQWRYRMHELLWQLLLHNGDVPLRALRETLQIGMPDASEPTAALHEHDLWEPGADTPIELDICAQRGPDLWIGEAKIANTLGREPQARSKLEGLRRAAEMLRPHGILFVTASAGWTDRTEEIAGEALAELPIEMRFASCPRPT